MVDQREHHGPTGEIVAEVHRAPVAVDEGERARDLFAELLDDIDLPTGNGGRRLGVGGRGREERERGDDDERALHGSLR